MEKPSFYKSTGSYTDMFYPKEAVVVVTEKSMKKTNVGITGRVRVGDVISLPIEILDAIGDADCKVGCFSYNFYFRTPNGVNRKFYESEKQLEKSVRLSLVSRGFEFCRWEDKQ